MGECSGQNSTTVLRDLPNARARWEEAGRRNKNSSSSTRSSHLPSGALLLLRAGAPPLLCSRRIGRGALPPLTAAPGPMRAMIWDAMGLSQGVGTGA